MDDGTTMPTDDTATEEETTQAPAEEAGDGEDGNTEESGEAPAEKEEEQM